MTFRLRLTVLTALAVAAAVVGTSFVVYYTDRSQLVNQVDAELRASLNVPKVAAFVKGGPGFTVSAGRRSGNVTQVVLPGSLKAVQLMFRARAGRPPQELPAIGPKALAFSTQRIGNADWRVLTMSSANVQAEVRTPLLDVERNLRHLRWLLLLISLGGIGAAAILGALVSRRAVAPLRRLTTTTERILETGDLSARTGQRGRDEISRLSVRLDELLASLDASLRTQRQLVADASHELRTPIATLRANVELLADPGALGWDERTELLDDVREELEAMTTLVGELVELARGEEVDVPTRAFRLDELVLSGVERAARRAPRVSFRTEVQPSIVTGIPERVERAVANLLDNAAKWSPAGEVVEVSVRDGVVEVRDHGPGISAEERTLVFNRFYRSAAARTMPGAGLGLAIVKQIADAHGGTVTIGAPDGGGASLRLQLSSTR
jgi:two-component system sensor histidine kinase MprB